MKMAVEEVVLQYLVFLCITSLSLCQLEPACFSSRNCRGGLVDGEVGCCDAGGGLSFRTGANASCQECFSTSGFESEGNNFFFGFFGNFEPVPYFTISNVRLYVTSVTRQKSNFTVTIGGTTTDYTTPMEIFMDANLVSVETDDVRDRGVVLRSKDSLSVVGYNEEFTSSDTFKILSCVSLPVQRYEYYAISVPRANIPVVGDDDVDDAVEDPLGKSVILIVTTEEDTELTISLTQDVMVAAGDILEQIPGSGFVSGVPAAVKLSEAAQTLHIASFDDLTGSRITSNKPIAFISGHECGTVPERFNYCDQLLEQVPPTATWGRSFITCPIAGRRSYDLFKVIASRNNSEIRVSCSEGRPTLMRLQEGEFSTFQVNSTIHCYISSTRPVLLVQYSIVSSVDAVFEGDPFMVIVPPVEQYRSSYKISTLSTSFTGAPESNYVNILLPEGVGSEGIRLNGAPLDESVVSFTAVPCGGDRGSCGSSASVSIPDGQHTLTHVDASVVFNAIVYWLSYRVGSGYFAGMTQNPIALPWLELTASVFTAFENQSSVEITISRSGDLSNTGSFRLKTIQNTALFGDDFEEVDGTFEFVADQTDVVVTVPLVDDVFPEEAEQFEVVLLASPGVFISSPASAIITIINDDPDLPVMNISFTKEVVEVAEGMGLVNLLLVKTEGAVGPVSVQLTTQDRTALDGEDYNSVDQTVTFEIEDLEKSVSVLILDNSALERVEQFLVSMTALPGLFPVAVINSPAVVSLTDNDVVVIGFSQCEFSIEENARDFSIEIQVLHGLLEESLVIVVTSQDGSAETGSDYFEVVELFNFTASVTSQVLSPVLIEDDIVEQRESFILRLEVLNQDGISVQLIQDQAVITIVDADEAVIGLEVVQSGALREGGADARLNVGLLQGGQLSAPVLVRIVTFNIDATGGIDFVTMNRTLEISNTSVQEVSVPIIDDLDYEGTSNEQFMVVASLEGATFEGRVKLFPSSVIISIEDNEVKPVPSIGFRDVESLEVCESDAEAVLIVTSNGENPEPVEVEFMFVGGSAQERDVGPSGGTLTFPAGSTVQFISIPIVDDTLVETEEQFMLVLQAMENSASISIGTVAVSIRDNDAVRIGFEEQSYSTSETGEVAIQITKLGEVNERVCVSVCTESGTALESVDYMRVSEVVCFAPSDDSMILTVPILADDIFESASGEMFLLRLKPVAANNTVQVDIIDSTATITIFEDPINQPSLPQDFECVVHISTAQCTWSQPAADSISNFFLSWHYDGPCSPDMQSFLLDGGVRSYTLGGLEEGGDFTIRLYAINSVGAGSTASVQVSTPANVPSGFPQSVRTVLLSSSSVRVQWSPVACLEANGPIEQYMVSYRAAGEVPTTVTTPNSMLVISDLTVGQDYSIRVAAANSVGTGPFSEPIELVLLDSDECAAGNDNCDANALCIDTSTSFLCLCNTGYRGDGITCADVDECSEGFNNCDCNADCANTEGSFTCSCKPGFVGNGITCSSTTVQFESSTFTSVEGDGIASLSVILSQPASDVLQVDLVTMDNTATSPSDYSNEVQFLTFLPGQTSLTVAVDIFDDSVDERNEEFTVMLTNPSTELSLGDRTSAVITILDDDETMVRFLMDNYEVSEGDIVEVFVVLSIPADRPVEVTIRSFNNTANSALDFVGVVAPLTFAPGAISTSFFVPTLEDDVTEGNEQFVVDLFSVTVDVVIGDPARAVVTIIDDDFISVGFLNTELLVAEDVGELPLSVGILSGVLSPSEVPLATIRVDFSDGSAVATEDFTLDSQDFTIPFSSQLPFMNVSGLIVDDDVSEQLEFFFGEISLVSGNAFQVRITNSRVRIEILSDDVATLGFDVTNLIVNENQVASLTFSVVDGELGGPIELTFLAEDLTATASEDYILSSDITLLQGGSVNLTVPIVDDECVEGLESFVITAVLSSRGFAVQVASSATIDIEDNDRAGVSFSSSSITVLETNNQAMAEVTVLLSGRLCVNVTVRFSTEDETATSSGSDRDFNSISSLLDFPPSEVLDRQMVTVPVIINGDSSFEPNETFICMLSSPQPQTLVFLQDPFTATVTIQDDDQPRYRIGFSATEYTVSEGDGSVSVTVTLVAGMVSEVVALSVVTEDGTAVAPADYASRAQAFIFTGRTQTVEISISTDQEIEPDEFFSVRLEPSSQLVGGVIDPSRATVTITNEPLYRIGFSATEYTVSESEGTVSVTVELLAGELSQPAVLSLVTMDGTATAPADYTLLIAPLFFFGDPLQRTVNILTDRETESSEFFSVQLVAEELMGGAIDPDRATVTITNACYNGELRLQGGESVTSGRVEICQDLVWGLICMNFWDNNDATVVCRQLGFSDQGAVGLTFFANSDQFEPAPLGTPFHLDDVECFGPELALEDCVSNADTLDCLPEFDETGVLCQP